MTPDEVAARYFKALEAIGTIRAQRWSETVARCSYCNGPEALRVGRRIRGLPEWVSVCADCSRPWTPAEIEVGLIRAPSHQRPDQVERRMLTSIEAVSVVRELAPIFRCPDGRPSGTNPRFTRQQ